MNISIENKYKNVIDIENKYKKVIDNIWNSPNKVGNGYALEKEIEKESLLFISMNPSDNGPVSGNGEFYNAPADTINNAIKLLHGGVKCTNKPPFAHHDLLFLRHTKQADVVEWMKKSNHKYFFLRQLVISKKIIKETRPKVIVVINAYASKLFQTIFDKCNPSFEKDWGTYLYEINNGVKTPVFFSSMLSSRHPLDAGSKERLQWHIGYVLDKLP